MIFLTVGTQLPFDRLTIAVDEWCARNKQAPDIFGQIGDIRRDSYRPRHFQWVERLDPTAFDKHVLKSSLIVSHAGMGSIIKAMSEGKPIVIMPRRAHLGEQRNDHQFGTAHWLGMRPGVHTAMTEGDLPAMIERATTGSDEIGGGSLSPYADTRLIGSIRDFIHSTSRE